ncbi:glycosyltransferase family 4 protein [Roseimicrobium sp. ORNL1]|uniref:glycosyltransferase family 4 protein n=1 Tax=Roseimicrobium sp. ORNL1 TaxID=2711231 RepID=UPI0013E10F77|nr:glycosyltransferase family 4 protein [Roseimicrobium sp. ORNL1]QIF02920.1 glycosyltransferase family 4 protein [Roseimicrobium sp. ORNL1]
MNRIAAPELDIRASADEAAPPLERPMRITILQGAFLPVPALMGGAVEKVWHEMGRQFAAAGHTVTHVSRSHPSLPAEEVVDGVRYLRVPGSDTPRSLAWLKVLDLFYTLRARKALPAADILVTNTFWAPLLLAGARHLGALVVSVQRMPKGQMRWYRKAACWHTVSSAVRDAILAEVPGTEEKIRVIPNPLPESQGSGDDGRLGAKEKVLLYAGRLHPEKGIELFLDALRVEAVRSVLVREGWRIEIVGPWSAAEGGGGESWMDRLRKHAEGLSVTFTGPVHDPALLRDYYQRAAIFVYPSLARTGETFGVAPLEAMAQGAVPVVSDLECFRDFIRDGVNGRIVRVEGESGVADLAEVLQKLMVDADERTRLAQAALAVRTSHAPERVAAMFLKDFALLSTLAVKVSH